ncbi:TAXI family TRAP transporter solute-binding subunit [Natrononativus amylolyticus]|uniref:TAXI family TRAP transporter solute-binding subunit n=1 Tax=Natrononativus amylolyticus TaxID=2963434 RepID=UPI0020CFA742|nr:TAXI family TRAP transporter solute-binding subunit [Natrononativus amylolyticus]
MRNHTNTNANRRKFLKAAGSTGLLMGVAGCLGDQSDEAPANGNGDDDGDSDSGSDAAPEAGDTELVMTTSTSGSASFAAGQGIAAIINEYSDSLFLDVQTSDGSGENIGKLDRDEADMGYACDWNMVEFDEGEIDLTYTPYQVFHWFHIAWPLVTHHEWESAAEITSDSRVSPAPAGATGTRRPLEIALEHEIGGEYEDVSFGYADQGAAMSEGRLDVGVTPYINFDMEPGYVQELKSTVDLNMLEWTDETASALEEDDRVTTVEFDASWIDGYRFRPENPLVTMTNCKMFVRDDYPYDPIYNFLSTLWDNREELADYHAQLEPYTDDEHWVAFPWAQEIPFHPAAADFYEEVGLWEDDFIRGEEA